MGTVEHEPAGKIASEAELILSTVRHTDFVHEPAIDPDTRTYKLDAAAFVSTLLESAAPAALARIPTAADERYPGAGEYCEFFLTRSLNGFVHVDHVREARRGDILAWSESKAARGTERGHVAVVAAPPKFDPEEKLWTMLVYDSSSAAHFDDSRHRGNTFHPGVGAGALKLRADSKGAPVAVQIGPRSPFNKRKIAIGRVLDPARAAASDDHAKSADPMSALGCRIERSAVVNESLGQHEFAIATYVLASGDAMLLVPTTIACWGPGQAIPQSVGRGVATYQYAGGVVFRSD